MKALVVMILPDQLDPSPLCETAESEVTELKIDVRVLDLLL